MSRLIKLLASPRLAAVLIAALIGLIVIAFWVPQESIFPAEQFDEWVEMYPAWANVATALGLHRLFSSWPFFLFAGLLAVNLLVCTWRRLARRLSAPQHIGSKFMTWGLAGSLVMHTGILVVMAGAVVSGQTTFSGRMLLTEGQVVPDAAESYLSVGSVPVWGDAFGDFDVGLDSVDFTYEDDVVTDAVARMVVVDDGERRVDDGRVNYPVRVQDKSFRLEDAGYSVGVFVTSSEGLEVFDSFVTLGEFAVEGTYDSVEITAGLSIEVLAVPDITAPLGEPAHNALEMRDVGVHVTPTGRFGIGERVTLRPGESFAFEDHVIGVYDVRRWHSFLVRSDGGLSIVYVGLALIVLGATLRFADPRERRKASDDD